MADRRHPKLNLVSADLDNDQEHLDSPAEEEQTSCEGPMLSADVDLETVLMAWHEATRRLERTHQVLRSEVRRLTDELEVKNRELARENRLADLGRMASHVAHEVRNNLVPVTLYLSLLKRRLSEDTGSLEILDKLSAGITDVDATVNDLLHFTAQRVPQFENIDVLSMIEEVRDALEPQLSAHGIEMMIDVPDHARLQADREMLRRALLNLALNAVDAMRDGGEIVVTAVAGPGWFDIELADSGSGLSEEVLSHAFEPFYTTKNTGTGLGLAIVDHIAAVNGGKVTAVNCPEGGAAFTLHFPQKRLEAQAA